MDVTNFLIFFENLFAKGIDPAQKAKEILVYLEGPAFDFYDDKFAAEDTLTSEAEDYGKVKDVSSPQKSPVINGTDE